MPKFAPVYMSVYDGADYALVDLVLDPATFAAASPEDTAIGTLTGMAEEDSTLTLVDDAGGAVKLVGDAIVVGPTASVAGTITITVRETNLYGSNNPHDTDIDIVVT